MVVAVWLSQLVVEEVDRRTTGSRLEEKECYPIDAHSCNVESFQFGFRVAREKDRRLKTTTPRPKVSVCRMCLSKGLGRRNKEHECSSCARHFIVSKVLSQWRKVGDRSKLIALTTIYIIVESMMMLNVSQISLTLLSDLTHLITPESQHHVLASTDDSQRWPTRSLYVSTMNEPELKHGRTCDSHT